MTIMLLEAITAAEKLIADSRQRADAAAVEASARAKVPGTSEVHGRDLVTSIFRGRARAAQVAFVDGDTGLVFAPGGQPRVVMDFVLENDRIVEISMIANPERIAALNLKF